MTDFRLGFIGTGAITKAVVTGLCQSSFHLTSVVLSPRNAQVAASLASIDERVSVGASNQDVVDRSDVVCIAVLPKLAPDAVNALKFSPRQTVISFVAGWPLDEVKRAVDADVGIARAIPLPATAQGNGSTVIYPPNEHAAAMFASIGAAVEVTDETQFDAFSAITATMASYYAFMEVQAQWLAQHGVPYEKARTFLAGYHDGLGRLALSGDDAFTELARECTTEGGINELMHRTLEKEGVFRQYGAALDAVWKRLEKS
ncbi:pyrroline-5-carboxylate reductase [Caballeronia sp. ATUFL_M2_KS44]|uniref:pyrroline-5-carboxylate reductase n=1 Tax=Caballeronia sp. ATUFL_M2_KS44 TaxID=2921767 RepID=UPI0020292370|nr:pyrroline-5-carboxylate reductase [Caballeronia sp. ATUFL_M2_KS44]